MMRLFILCSLYVLFFACENSQNSNAEPYQYIPNTFTTLIKINDASNFTSESITNPVLKALSKTNLTNAVNTLQYLNPNTETYLALLDSSNYIMALKYHQNILETDSLSSISSEVHKPSEITHTKIENHSFFHKVENGIFLVSNHSDVLKNLTQNTEAFQLKKQIETTDKNYVANLIFSIEKSEFKTLLFNDLKIKEPNNFCVIDIETNTNNLIVNGVLNFEVENLLTKRFKTQKPKVINTLKIAPNFSSDLTSITYSNFETYIASIDSTKTTKLPTFLNYTNEAALINFKTENAIAFNSLDSNLLKEHLLEHSVIETHHDIPVFEFENALDFSEIFAPFFSYNKAVYGCVYNNFLLLSNTSNALKSIINSTQNNQTLAQTEAIKAANTDLNSNASVFMYKNNAALSAHFNTNLKGFNTNIVQLVFEDNFAHVNGVYKTYKKQTNNHQITETFSVATNAASLIAPQVVKSNKRTSQNIVIQDVNNVLYYISNSGKTLWKTKLQGKILGNIKTIDLNKNGNYYLTFTTKNRLYVLDKNGKNATGFPLKLDDAITQPLSVFDYDNNKKYRLLVTQGKNLLMYDAKGKMVKGFKYNPKATIKTQPKHFRINRKDYIVFATEKKLKILNRRGTVRLPINKTIRFSNNSVFQYKNQFAATNTLGELLMVNTKGKLTKKPLNLTENHYFETTNRTLVTLMDNQLTINYKTLNLDYGNYTKPQIFYINNKIYVTTTDLQAKKVYVFDSQAKPIKNFPVFGTSAAILTQLDKDNALELVTQSDDKTVLVYEVN